MRSITELPLLSGHSAPAAAASIPLGSSEEQGEPSSAQNSSNDHTAARPGSAARSSARSTNSPNQPDMNGNTHALTRTASAGPPAGRPTLSRAKSDFGPRLQEPADSADEASSSDGNFKIRHGWDDQLNSEEYNNLLTSVCTCLFIFQCTGVIY